MIDVNKVLGAATTMQQNAQSALPVIPNNGNPAGAHNMPQQQAYGSVATARPEVASPYFYPWLGPSPYMESIKSRLSSMQVAPAQPLPVQQSPATPLVPDTGAVAPVMPQVSSQLTPQAVPGAQGLPYNAGNRGGTISSGGAYYGSPVLPVAGAMRPSVTTEIS